MGGVSGVCGWDSEIKDVIFFSVVSKCSLDFVTRLQRPMDPHKKQQKTNKLSACQSTGLFL